MKLSFKVDIDKIKSLPPLSKEKSRKLKKAYDRDIKIEKQADKHSGFTPIISIRKENINHKSE